jgi:hypothetical protein
VTVEVRFEPSCGIDVDAQVEIEAVLRRVPVGSEPGHWPKSVHAVEVVDRLTGGRSGSDVLELRVRRDRPEITERYVAKLGPAEAARAEWAAFLRHLASKDNVLLLKIKAVTAGVLGSPSGGLPGDREAVIYQHITDFAAEPRALVRTLEDIVAAGFRGGPADTTHAIRAISRLMRQAGIVLYAHARPETQRVQLRWLNRTLGPDLVVEVDNVTPAGELRYQTPLPPHLDQQRVYPRDVMMAACLPAGRSTRQYIGVGSLLRLHLDEIAQRADGVLLGRADDVSVEIRIADSATGTLRPEELAGRDNVDLHARVVAIRAHDWWSRLTRLLPVLGTDGDRVTMDGIRMHHPFEQLGRLLSDPAPGWVASLVHGDLNPRNVLMVGEQVCLIDYSETKDGQPLLGDPAWLEVGLLRDVVAGELSLRELVQLQRLLGVACRLSSGPAERTGEDIEPPAQIAAMLDGTSAAFDRAFRILWAVREGARDAYPDSAQVPWWRDYLGALTLAACRTLKWPDEVQTAHTVAAAVVVAGTAAELLEPAGRESPFRNWSIAELETLIGTFARPRDGWDPGEESLLADLVTAIDQLGVDAEPPGLARSLEDARAAMIMARCGEAASRLLPELRRRRGPFIRLRGQVGAASAADGTLRPDVDALSTIAGMPAGVLLGAAGSGKSTVLRELQYQLVATVAGDRDGTMSPVRMAVLLRASAVVRELARLRAEQTNGFDWVPPGPGDVVWRLCGFDDLMGIECFTALLTIGAFHVLLDGFDELTSDDRAQVVSWLKALRDRHPRSPLVVCHRSFGHRPEVLGFPSVTLREVAPDDAVGYLRDALRAKGNSRPDDCVRELADALNSPDYRRLRELTRTPLFLWMIVEWHAGAGRVPAFAGELFAEFTAWFLNERHHAEHDEQRRGCYELAIKHDVLQAIACHLVEHGNITELPANRVGELCAGMTDRSGGSIDEVLEEIVGSEMLQRDGDRLRFMHQLFQEYFAACALGRQARENREVLVERVLSFNWREPTRILLSSPETSHEVVVLILERAIDTDARYGAWLLRAARNVPTWLRKRFVEQQTQRLRSPATGKYGCHSAARALAEDGTGAALDALVRVACDASVPDLARAEVIDVLLGACRTANFDAVREVGVALNAAVTDVLVNGAPEAVILRALRATAEAKLVDNIGLAWELVDPEQPWPVVNAAYRVLIEVGAALSAPVRGRYLSACVDRLAELERALWSTVEAERIDRLQNERFTILEVLAEAGHLDIVLVRRFSFGLADRPGWADMLRAAAGHDGWVGHPLARLITAQPTADTRLEWLAVFAQENDLAACAAAHRLLADDTAPPEELLNMVTPDCSAARLLVAAAVVECLGPQDLWPAEELVRGLTARLDGARPELLEPLAALVSALDTPGHAQRISLAHLASSVLRERDVRQSMYWPWATVWCDTVLDEADLARLLDQGTEGALIVSECISSVDFLLTASAHPPELHLSQSARQQLHALRPESPDGLQASRFVMTVSYAGLVELLPYVESVALSEINRRTLARHANAQYGVLEVALASHAVSAIGYLGRVLAENGRGGALEACRLLHDMDTADLHPSVERARLVGLGLLGDWQNILERLTPDDPVLRDAAENIVAHWVPGPFTPSDQGPVEIARWIDQRLLEEAEIDPLVRSALEHVKAGLESRVGHYVAGRVNKASGRPLRVGNA